MTEQRCSSCKTVKAESSFSVSKRGKNGFWCQSCVSAYDRSNRIVVVYETRRCGYCGADYRPAQRKNASVYCSRICLAIARSAAEAKRREASRPLRSCLQCGMRIAGTSRSDAVFCSRACTWQAHRLKRKLRARGGNGAVDGYIRSQIADRDKWRCGICGGSVHKARRHPDPMCGSLDHIVPVSQGGTSEPANLRLTHLVCNVRRGNRGGGEQLALH